MSELTKTELSLVQNLLSTLPDASPSPAPGLNASDPKAALRRCCAAWRRAFKAYMDDCDSDEETREEDELFAADDAGKAYRSAMPMLVDYEGIRDFIACAAHGILIGAIPADKSGQLLYAAQVALNTCRRGPKLPKAPSA